MPILPLMLPLLGDRKAGILNIVDSDSPSSKKIAAHIFRELQIPATLGPQNPGGGLEKAVADHLQVELANLDPGRAWAVSRNRRITLYSQYAHLYTIAKIAVDQPALRAELPHEYIINPDVTVGLPASDPGSLPTLHASVSCKWTLRSDRAQSIRHEATILVRTRRDRLPHVVAVTAEPLPSRLASLARGTGELDAVYHIALDELDKAVQAVGNTLQKNLMKEMIGQGRLRDLSTLAQHLVEF